MQSKLLPLILSLVLVSGSASAFITDPAYHHLDEINARIFALQDSLPDWVRVDSIGYSQADHLPIYAVKISNDVKNDSSGRPAVIIFGQVHAEEVLGVEFAMWLLERMVGRRGNASAWRNRIDTWIVPTANPEGLNVVYTLDYTYRKNKRDNIGDGLFRHQPGWGMDSSGVDVNRNFPFYWINGDGLLKPGGNEFYDYYRGPAPLSEPESQAMDRLNDCVRPIYTVVLHSSRTGNFAERVIYPWDFEPNDDQHVIPLRKSPDFGTIRQIANDVANRCRTYAGSGAYQPSAIMTPVGDSDLYFYYQYGSFSYRIEIGEGSEEGMQPDSAGIQRVIDGIRMGLEYYLNSAAGKNIDDEGTITDSRISVQVTDAATGLPLSARLRLTSLSQPIIPFRTTNPRTGVYHWVLPENHLDTLTITAFGYRSRIGREYSRANPDPDDTPIMLTPLPRYRIRLNTVTTEGVPVSGNLELTVEHLWAPTDLGLGSHVETTPVQMPYWCPSDSLWTMALHSGSVDLDLPEGGYRFTIFGGQEFVPRQLDLIVDSSRTWNISLSRGIALLAQDFDGDDLMFTSDNLMNVNANDSLARWDVSPDVYHSGPRSLTDTERGNTPLSDDSWCAPYNLLDTHFDLSSAQTASLVYWISQALDPGYDSVWVEASTNAGVGSDPSTWTWRQLAPAHQDLSRLENVPTRPWNAPPINYQRYAPWKRFVIPLDSLCGEPVVQFRFHLRSDIAVARYEQDGVYIDDVLLMASDEAPIAPTSQPIIPRRFALGSPFPNPFNGRVQVRVSMPQTDRLKLVLYDLTGRAVLMGYDAVLSEGNHVLSLNAAALPTGLYFLQAETGGLRVNRKVMLIK